MSRKAIIWAVVSLVLLTVIASCWAYYYYVETVNDYVLIKVTPPDREESIFRGYTYSKPKFEFEALPNYKSDDEAVAEQTHKAKENQKWLLSHYEEELTEANKEPNPIIKDARIKAYQFLMSESRILIRSTHIRKFSANEAFQMVIDHWADKSLEDYAKSKKIDVAVYNIL